MKLNQNELPNSIPTSSYQKSILFKNKPSVAEIDFYDDFFKHKSDYYFNILKNIDWDIMYERGSYGNPIIRNARKMKWFSFEKERLTYAFSSSSLGGLTISTGEFNEGGLKANNANNIPVLVEIREKIIELLKSSGQSNPEFNYVLINYYHDEKDSVAWHSDDDPWLGKQFTVPSITFGSERLFCLKVKGEKDSMNWTLKDGSVLLMKGMTQEGFQHSVPPMTISLGPRINLTFRNVLKSYINKQPKGTKWITFKQTQLNKYSHLLDDQTRKMINNAKSPKEIYALLLLLHRVYKSKNTVFNLHEELKKHNKPSDIDFIYLNKILNKK